MAWHLNDLTLATGAPSPENVIRPKGYAFEAQGTQHVIYVVRKTTVFSEADNHIHELWRDSNGWHHSDLSAATSTPPQSNLAAYAFEAQGTQHVFYVEADSKIHELWWDSNGWHHNDLTAAIGAPPAWYELTAYAFEAQGTQHVIYRGRDSHIHELWWDSSGWHHNDLTTAAGAPLCRAIYPDSGYTFETQNTQHVIYLGEDSHIQELWWDLNGWHHNDLTAATGAPEGGFGLAAYAFEAQGTQHVVYWGSGDHIHELWWDSNGWHHNDLTVAANVPAYSRTSRITTDSADSELFGYTFEAIGTQHVVYGTSAGVIRELWWDSSNGWDYSDLTAAVDDPLPFTEPAAYVFNMQRTQHIVYLQRHAEGDIRIYELYGKPDLFFPSKRHPIHHPSPIPPNFPHPPDPGRF